MRYEKNQHIIDYYRYRLQYPKFLAINKIWLNDNGVEILVNTDYNQYYLLNLEPGNYKVDLGQMYGTGDIIHKNLTGHLLPTSLLDIGQLLSPGLIRYKTHSKTWQTFADLRPNSMALWLNRGSYFPSHVWGHPPYPCGT